MANETAHMNTISIDGGIGEVQIADEVVAIIAGLAAADVKGVASLAGNVTRDLIGKTGIRSLSKGVRLTIDNGEVHVAESVNIQYGYNVPDTCAKVQERVKTAIETMTGLHVAEVNIKVASVVMEKADKSTKSDKGTK